MFIKHKERAISFILALLLLLGTNVFAQKSITGRVLGPDRKPVQGASVSVKGATTGTQTDADGNFRINAASDATLVISFVGFASQEIAVNNSQSVGTISLSQLATSLNEIVVTGYSSQKKKDLTGSVAIVNMEAAKKQPVADLNNMLQGQVSGLTVVGTGQPGQTPQVRIRGFNTFGNNAPLFVVDGVPTQNINDINPNDIASTQVLKDAGASSIYGSRASNGVIIVTTRKGTGKVKVSYDGYVGTQKPKGGNVWDILSPQEMGNLKWLAYKNSGKAPTDAQFGSGTTPVIPDYILPNGAKAGDPGTDPSTYYLDPNYNGSMDGFHQIVQANKTGTDWYHQIFRNAPITQHNLAVTGGNDQAAYLFSVNYFNQQGTLINTYLRRFTIRANSTYKITNFLRVGENMGYSVISNPQAASGILVEGSAIGMAFRENPMIPVYDIKGNYAGSAGKDLGNAKNPVAIQQRTANNKGLANRLFGNIFGEVDILKNLTARTSFGGEVYSGSNHSFAFPEYENSENLTTNSYTETAYSGYNWTWTNTLAYHLTAGDHDLKLLGGTEAYLATNRNLGGTTLGYLNFDPNYTSLSTGLGTQTNYSNQNNGINSTTAFGADNTLVSYFGRLDYTFKDKYLLGATVRRDGSSKFTTNRWGTFPAVSIGWRISQENFMKNVGWITDLKIRGSYGTMGNQFNALGTNSYTLYGTNKQTTYYPYGGSAIVQGVSLQQFGNPNGKWEKDKNLNVGFDGTFFKGALEVTADYYHKDIKDLLYQLTFPGTYGAGTVPAFNVASMKNSGVDVAVTGHINIAKDLKLDATGTFTTFSNTITQIDASGTPYFDQDSRRFNGSNIVRNAVGHSISQFYGYKVTGFWQSQAEIDAANAEAQKATGNPNAVYQTDAAVGRFRYADSKNQHQITNDSKVFLGNPSPDFSYGLNLGLTYKDFDFSMFLYGVQGNDIWNNVKWWTDFYGSFPGGANSKTALYNSWTPTNTHAKAPIQEAGSYFSTQSVPNSYFVENGSYLRCKNMQLGYSFNFASLKKAGISRLRAYVQAANLFTITKYSGIDPEISTNSGNVNATTDFGIDEGAYANPRQYLFGIQVVF
ncbi:SusC/RagA family TonB-linked outer membrane protein [Deminuibacter soli]|uniref:TonB-dependent receptor n=1 Tax=Deminuibacter soli TaxID=2291815 RepID=A0A3E1NL02_9BACT|nr:TonB-dependent receptor [Deminuibacter soli]RFM28468.1 TonB-dependent receptor [Deminuibacter soli]